MALATQMAGIAVILGFTGVVASLGFDGLALPLGLVAGAALIAILVAPALRNYAGSSLPEVFAARYGCPAIGRAVTVVMIAAAVLLLSATLKSAAVALQSVLPVDHAIATGIMAAAVVLFLCSGRHIDTTLFRAAVFVVVALGVLCALALIAQTTGTLNLAALTLGAPLQQHADLNQSLVLDKLANVSALTPLASPFLQMSARNFAGLVIAVALGIAAAPFLIRTLLNSDDGEGNGGVVGSAAGAAVLVALIAVMVSPLAIYSRIAFEQQLSRGIDSKDIPQPVADASGLRWVKVCEANSALPIDVEAACAKVSGQKGKLRLQDIAFSADGQVLGAHRLAAINPARDIPIVLASILAALIAGRAILASCLGGGSASSVAFFASAPIAALSAYAAAVSSTASGFLAAEGFALLGAALFPALVLGLYWRRMNAAGGAAAIAVGALVAGLYIAGTHLWPEMLFRLTGPLSDVGLSAAKRIADLRASAASSSDSVQLAALEAEIGRVAEKSANWFGLKPAAVVLIAAPLSLMAGILGSIAYRPRPAASSTE